MSGGSGQRATPLARGGAQLQRGSSTPRLGARQGAGAAPWAAVLLLWVVSLQQLLSCWAGKRRLEDGAQGGGRASAPGPWPARPSVGAAERSTVPCALTDFSFRARSEPAVCRDDSLVRQLDVRHCAADTCHRLRGPGGGSTERPGDFAPPWAVWAPPPLPPRPRPPPPAQARSCVTADARPEKPRRFIPEKPGTLRDLRKTSTPCLPAVSAQEVYLQYI